MTLEIIEKQIAYNKSPRNVKPRYIVIHDTGNKNTDAGAQRHFDYFNGGNRGASADFFVDDKQIVRANDYIAYYTWHCGDGKGKYGITNENSIGIEICVNADGDYKKAVKNTIALTKQLMAELDITAKNVVRHYDASRKNCPASMTETDWADFKERLGNVSKFKDIKNHYAENHIKKLEDYGIINGDGNGKFNPDAPLTRADAAIMVANALNVLGK